MARSMTSWSVSAKQWFRKAMELSSKSKTGFSKIPPELKNIRGTGLKKVVAWLKLSPFLIMGLVTLGACLFAGIVTVVMVKLQKNKDTKSASDVESITAK